MNLVENGLVDTAREGAGGTSSESSTDVCRPSCVKQTVGSCYNTGSPAWCSVMTEGVGLVGRGGRLQRGYI